MLKLVFFANYLNIHQVHLMDELFALLGGGFRFVATLPRNSSELKGGDDYSSRCYCVLASESCRAKVIAKQMACEAEVCVFGACSQEYALARARGNPSGLSFEVGERWLKRGWVNAFSSSFLEWFVNYRLYYRHRPFYKLCCSAFTASDDIQLGVYKGRHFKWGYFTGVTAYDAEKTITTGVSIMWCSRFLKWKHPELAIELAKKLKDNGYKVMIDMYGSGSELEASESLCRELSVQDVVSFKGSVPNDEIIQEMRRHDIFLFTSDKKEGWGAVLNEAMSNRCAVVASEAIGAAPFLIRDGRNGLLFKSRQVDSLYEKVIFLLNNPAVIQQVSEQAYQDMLHIWSPRKAAENLIQLINDLRNGQDTSILDGPCSKAE